MSVIWKDPPPKWDEKPKANTGTGRGRHAAYVRQLQSEPMRWAYFGVAPNATIGTHFTRHYPGVQYTSRKRDDGQFDIYLRWIEEA